MIAIIPLLIAVVGALTYGFAGNGKLQRLGEITFFVGLLWFVYPFVGKVARLF